MGTRMLDIRKKQCLLRQVDGASISKKLYKNAMKKDLLALLEEALFDGAEEVESGLQLIARSTRLDRCAHQSNVVPFGGHVVRERYTTHVDVCAYYDEHITYLVDEHKVVYYKYE